MKNSILAKRYAKALFGFALEADAEQQVFDDLKLISLVLGENKNLRLLLLNPLINTSKKQKVFNLVFNAYISPITGNFLKILIRKGRGKEVVGIAMQYKVFFMEHRNLVPVELTTAMPVHDKIKQSILERFAHLSDKQMEVTDTIDENIIGGFKLRMGDYLLDATVRNIIARMHKEFDKNLFVKGF